MGILQDPTDPLAHFIRCVPRTPYATDNFEDGIWRQRKRHALRLRYIQPNDAMVWCLTFDCDHDAARWANVDGILPEPNFCALNQDDGAGHLAYFLKHPVARTDAARLRPLRYLAKIQMGLMRRLDADPAYVGLLTKNPLHPHWRTVSLHSYCYQLAELDAHLHDFNCKKMPRQESVGLGRNCILFNEISRKAYAGVRTFLLNDAHEAAFHLWVHQQAAELNAQFDTPMQHSEVRSIVRSVARWVWRNFSFDGFSRSQSARGRRGAEVRWAGHTAVEVTQPWLELGISRATYYRRKKHSK